MARMTKACPLLAAADIGKTVEWYCDKLGFARMGVHDGYGLVRRDDVEIHFWKSDDRNIAENTSAYIRVDDADAVHAALKRAEQGGRISPVADQAWGMREFYIWDPDGNLLRFGQYTGEGGSVLAS